MKLFIHWMCAALIMIALGSCSSSDLIVSNVGYQSVRTSFARPDKIPETANIAVEFFINAQGELLAVVYNLSREIVTIDQTNSFLIDTNGQSMSYYDPTVRSSTSGDFSSSTSSTSFNLSAISSIFGLRGPLGSILNATSVNNANTVGTFSSNTVTVVDQPSVRIGPKGNMAMSKQFKVQGIGKNYLRSKTNSFTDVEFSGSPLHFSTCISYSVGDNPKQKLVTDFYVNSSIVEPVKNGKVNDSFRKIYSEKADALAENSFMFVINTNLPTDPDANFYGDPVNVKNIYDNYVHGSLIDYQ